MSLQELTNEFIFLRQYFDGDVSTEEGEQMLVKLNTLSSNINQKGINIGLLVKDMEGEIKKFKEAECTIKQRRKITENKLERLKEYLKTNMKACNISKISNEYLEIKLKKNPIAVELYNERLLPEEYFKVKTVQTVDKLKIKEDITNGKEVPGAILKQETHVRIK